MTSPVENIQTSTQIPAKTGAWDELLRAPVNIGGVTISPRLVLSPMAGLTDMYYRRIIKRIGGVGLTVSEIISSTGLHFGNDETRLMLRIDDNDRPVSLQIAGSNPQLMAQAAVRCEQEGADLIDINMGCPAKKVNKSAAGCALMRDPKEAAQITAAVVNAVKVPVTVKMRLGWDDSQLNLQEVAQAVVDAGAQMVAVHGRTRAERFKGHAVWEPIAELKTKLSVPVFANGDIDTPEKVRHILEDLHLDGAFIGRSAIQNPWLFKQINQAARGETVTEPTPKERRDVMLYHFRLLLEGETPKGALHKMKTFLGKYTKGFAGAAVIRRELSECFDPEELYQRAEKDLPLF